LGTLSKPKLVLDNFEKFIFRSTAEKSPGFWKTFSTDLGWDVLDVGWGPVACLVPFQAGEWNP
jgi:hypothetical protein